MFYLHTKKEGRACVCVRVCVCVGHNTRQVTETKKRQYDVFNIF